MSFYALAHQHRNPSVFDNVWSIMKSSAILATVVSVAGNALAQELDCYNIDPKLVSVSGISSGGYMAGQLGVAYSGTFQTGFGVFAAGPFDCARDQYVR